ncbi:Uncharacterised protein [Mycobacteroides abscessus subsp. abscessus]|nr:Uncharacterised protein [Mycobacteroides abscessus subsp. abscessus]
MKALSPSQQPIVAIVTPPIIASTRAPMAVPSTMLNRPPTSTRT